jgi:hypothetical protein
MRAGFLAAVLLLAACAGAPPTSPSPTPGEPVRILETGLSASFEDPFTVAAATNQADYEALWQNFNLRSLRPAVDFGTELVLYFGMAGSSSCPEGFQQLVIEDDVPRVYATWQTRPPNQPCTDDLAPQGVLLAVNRAVLPGQPFTLQLRDELVCPDCPEHPDRALIDPTEG